MAQFYLIAGVTVGLQVYRSGQLIDDAVVDTAPLTSAGALLWPATNTGIAAAAAIVAAKRTGAGISEEAATRIMRDAVDADQKALDRPDGGAGLDASHAANVANNATTGAIEIVFPIDVPDGTTGNVDVVVAQKIEIVQIEVIKKAGAGGASDTVQVLKGASAITNAMSLNVADQTVVRPTTVDDAFTVLDVGDTLRATRTKVTANVACLVVVRAIRRA